MRNNVSSTSLKSLLESYDRDAAANGRKKISTAGSSGVSGMKSSASTLASAIPEKTVVPEISAADAKSLMNAYYKPMLHEAKEAADAEKKAQAEAKKASKKKSSSISIDDPNADGPADDFWSNTGKSDNKDNSAKPGNNSNSEQEKEDDKEKKPGLLARAGNAIKNGAVNIWNSMKETANERQQERIQEAENQKVNKADELDAARQAAAQNNSDLIQKKNLTQNDKNVIFQRYNNFVQQGDNRKLVNTLNELDSIQNDLQSEVSGAGDNRAKLEATLDEFTPEQIEQAKEYLDMYARIPGYRVADRTVNTITGTGKTVGSGALMANDSWEQHVSDSSVNWENDQLQSNKEELENINAQIQEMQNLGNAYVMDANGSIADENGNLAYTPEFESLLNRKKEIESQIKEGTVENPVSKDTAGYKLYQSAQEDLARSDLGLSDTAKILKGAATSAAENIAIAAVNPAAVLPILSLQGAAGSMGEDISNEVPAGTTLVKGAAKFAAGYAINSVGVEQMLNTMGVDGARNTLASQIVRSIKSNSALAQSNPVFYAALAGAGDNGLQSFAEYWADRAIDLATNTAQPKSMEQLLTESLSEMGSGALGGAFTGLAGSAVNAGRQYANKDYSKQQSANAEQQSSQQEEVPLDPLADAYNLKAPEQATGEVPSPVELDPLGTDYNLQAVDNQAGAKNAQTPNAAVQEVVANLNTGENGGNGNTNRTAKLFYVSETNTENRQALADALGISESELPTKDKEVRQFIQGLTQNDFGLQNETVQPVNDDLLLPADQTANQPVQANTDILDDGLLEPIAQTNAGDGGYGANTVGAAESKFDRSTAPNLDIAEQTGIQNQLNDAAQNAYGESNQLQHDVYSHKQGEYEAAMNLDLSVSEAGGDTNAGINNEVKRLTDVAQWNAEDQHSAKEVRNRILQQLNQAAESGADTTELVARLHAVDDLISMKRSQIGQALEAGKEAALSSENVSQKFSQYKQEQAQKFANKDKNAAKTMEEIASEISDADLSGQQKDFILDFIKERAKAKNVDMTDAQAEKLAQMVQMGAKTEQFYNTILEFATGIDDLSLDQIEQIDNLIYEAEQLPENSRDRVEKEKQVYAIMASTVKAGFMDKVNAWRYFAMLGNTRTHARNIIGNEAMGLVTGAKDVTATLIEHAVIRNKNDRTKAVLLPTKADNELLGAAYKYANESRYRQLTDNSRFNVKSGIEGEKTVFKNRVTEKARLANNAGLEESDYSGTFGELAVIKEIGGKPGEWAGKIMEKANKAGENGKVGFAGLRAQFARSMAQQMKAKGLSADILTSTDPKDIAIVERMADTAVADAQRATFHEDSNTASWLSDKNKPAWVRILTDAELPFTKTPINIVKQAARYSPMGIVKTATVDAYNLSKGNITINKFVDNLAMGLTGTGIALAGAWLADSGILFVPDKDDKKQSFNEMQGKQGYSIIIDGKSYTIDWLAPAALPLLMGASIAKEAKQEGFGFDNIADSISSLADPMIETTMLSSLSDTLESIRYSESGSGIFSTLLVGGATNYAGQFVPTALGQVARSQDEHRRSNKSFASSKTGKQAEYFMRKQINKIPGLGEALDDLDLYENADYVDAWGRKQENGGLAYNALSPGYLRDVDTTRADQYIDDLYNEVGSEAVLPNVSSSKADVDLTPDSYEKYATEKGQTQAALIDELAGQEYISDMPAEVQKKIVSDLYSVAKMAGNKSVDPLWESDSKSDQKLYGIYEDLGEIGLVNYVAGSKAFEEIKSSDNPAETAELYSGILDELTPEMVETYMSKDYKKPYQAYKEGGIKAMAAYEQASDRFSEINDRGGEYADAVLSLDDMTPAEQGYIYMLHADKDEKVKFLTDHYSKNTAYKLSYWFMRYSAIKDKLKAQIKDTNITLSAAREAWANQYISNEQEREDFIYLYKTARKDWKFE